MRKLDAICFAVIGVFALGMFLRALTIKIPPGYAGVLNAEWTAGLVEQDYGPGFHWDIGPLHTWIKFDTTVQTFNMSLKEDEGPLQVKSADGATVTIDVTVKYKIKAGRTWKVLKDNGPGDAYKIKVRNEAINVLRRELGALKTEEFYDPRVRQTRAAQMEAALGVRMATLDIELVKILIRDLKFDEAFEQRIREKSLAQQDVEVNQAKTEATKERGKTNDIVAQTKAKVVVIDQEKEKALVALRATNDKTITGIRADATKKEIETRSDADLYAAQLRAQGELEVKRAEAEGERMRRESLSGAGADVLVALELAKSLKLEELTISTQMVDPLDVDAMLRRFGVK